MKKFLLSLAAMAQSKKNKTALIGLGAAILAHKIGLPEEVAASIAGGVFWVIISLIVGQAGLDIATKGKSSHSTD